MESFAHYFNKHIAKKIELDDITIIDYHSPEYNLMYNLRYIFDKKNSSLAITGETTLNILLKKSKHLVEIFLFMTKMKLKKLFLSISLIISDMKN